MTQSRIPIFSLFFLILFSCAQVSESPNESALPLPFALDESDGRIDLSDSSYDLSDTEPLVKAYRAQQFGTGIATTTLGSSDDVARSVAFSPSGNFIYAVGRKNVSSTNDDFALTAFYPSGVVAFASTADASGANRNDIAHAIAVQTDGKIVIGGRTHNGTNFDWALYRYLSTGAVDTSFGSAGKRTHTVKGGTDILRSLFFQTDGKITAAGYTFNSTHYDFATARYTAAGAVDVTFGSGGVRTLDVVTSKDDVATTVVTQGDGKVLVAGATYNASPNWDIALARYLTDGELDSDFGSSGKVTSTVASGNDIIWNGVLDGDGKFVGVGETAGTGQDILSVRYRTNGTIDTAFGTGGAYKRTAANNQVLRSVKMYGTLLAAAGEDNSDFHVVRLLSTGALDTTFSGDGLVSQTIGSGEDVALGLAARDGYLMAAGRSSIGGNFDLGLLRLGHDGAIAKAGFLDVSFNRLGGISTATQGHFRALHAEYDYEYDTDPGNFPAGWPPGPGFIIDSRSLVRFEHYRALAIQADGKIVAAGDAACCRFVVRYLSTGVLDSTFNPGGGDGDLARPGMRWTADGQYYGVVVQTDGRILAAGTNLTRYATNGVFDTTYGTSGVKTDTVGDKNAIILQTNGLAVTVGGNNGNKVFIARYRTTGALDTSFGTAGANIHTVTKGGGEAIGAMIAYAVAGISGGEFISGAGSNSEEIGPTLMRYLNTGALNTNFSYDGVRYFNESNLESGGFDITGLGVHTDGRYVIGGGEDPGQGKLWRVMTNGVLDTTFGTSGMGDTAGTKTRAIAIQPDGNILISGFLADTGYDGNEDPGNLGYVQRNQSPGLAQHTFGADANWGFLIAPGAGCWNPAIKGGEGRALALQSDGRIIMAGNGVFCGSANFIGRLWP